VTRVAVIAVTPLLCLFTSLFAVQFRLDLIPRHERLTIAECFTDKLNLVQARRRKVAVQQAEALLQQGLTDSAVKSLEQTANTYGRNRDVLNAMRKAYRAAGNTAEAENTEWQWEALQQSRMW
jgi:predicted Zn-dependent protease